MATRYDLYQSPQQEGEEKKRKIHARLVTEGTVETGKIAEKIQFSSSLTIGDVKAVLSSLSHYVGEMLADGKRVHIEGLGYFQMTLTSPVAETSKDIRGDQISFKSVAFRPEKALKERLKQTTFARSTKKSIHSPGYTEEELDNLLAEYFETHHYITRADFQRIGKFTRSTALVRLRKLTESGKLKKQGNTRSPFYVPATDQPDN